jgi:hypothetical protein
VKYGNSGMLLGFELLFQARNQYDSDRYASQYYEIRVRREQDQLSIGTAQVARLARSWQLNCDEVSL